ncbi:hypothetical protein ABZ721_31485 [Streptomyces sp. NPDC006733]|uniref:hypothetical protein n=1 Tax=Streptomyces sp. NPDC006733 TaxID=3155460 RepID=UPI0033EC8107
MADAAWFAWCFDHGRLHTFAAVTAPWCTAAWVRLHGDTEAEALQDKVGRFGSCVYFDQLSADQVAEVLKPQ